MLKNGATAEEQEPFAGILTEEALLKQYNIESLATVDNTVPAMKTIGVNQETSLDDTLRVCVPVDARSWSLWHW